MHEHRLFAIGDIHGCADELDLMLKAIAPAEDDTVVFVGDYIDRGPGSRDVIELLLEFQRGKAEVIFLKGNHEDMMLSYLGLPGHYGESFLFNGGIQTLASYGLVEDDGASVREMLPATHRQFLAELKDSYTKPPYFFVHAGIAPGVPLNEQNPEDLLWIRQEFIFNPHDCGVTVVFGHTPLRTVMVDLPFKIGIDTGLVYGGKLTCIELTEGVIHQIARGSQRLVRSSLELS